GGNPSQIAVEVLCTFPPGGGRGHVKLCPLRRRSRPALTPTLTLDGGGDMHAYWPPPKRGCRRPPPRSPPASPGQESPASTGRCARSAPACRALAARTGGARSGVRVAPVAPALLL